MTVGLAFENKGFVAFEESDQLLCGENGANFKMAIFFGKLDLLAGFEVEFFTDLFWDDDLEFGGYH